MSRSQVNLATEERLRRLTDELTAHGSVTIVSAAAELDVSEMTIRRDLIELEERGIARRVRGGALPLGPQTFAERSQARSKAKGLIASKLSAFIPATGTIALDASTTVMRAASALAGARDLMIVTNGPETFQALQRRPGVTPVLTGGQLDERTGSLVGSMASWSARQLNVDRFITSCAGIDTSIGATEAVVEEADVKRAIASGAAEVVVAIDSSKMDRRAIAVCLAWDRIDVLVTELDPADRRLDPYRKLARLL